MSKHRQTEDHWFRPESVFFVQTGALVIVASDGWGDWVDVASVNRWISVGEAWGDADV